MVPRAPGRSGALAIAVVLLAWLALAAAALGATTAGFQDASFGTSPSAPTTKEPQNKLWFNDGIWWGGFYVPGTGAGFRIHRLNTATQTWTSTGTTIDTRSASRADTLWDGTKLYVASANPTETGTTNSARVYRFSYNAATDTYTPDAGFPVTISTGGMQAITIAKDGQGVLWAAYTQGSRVMVTHTTTSDAAWVTPYVLPATASTGLLAEDEADIVAYNGRIGIMWSKQTPGSEGYLYAEHVDGASDQAWASSAPIQGAETSDNHLSLYGLSGDPAGQVFAAVKTSLNASGLPLQYVLVLSNSGTWQTHVFGRTQDNHTRVQLALDTQNRRLYAFGSSPCCSGGAIYYKVTSLDAPSFATGLGTPLMQSTTSTHLNDVTTTRQPVSSATGLVTAAGDASSNLYFHSWTGLGAGDTQAPDTAIDSGPSGTIPVTSAVVEFSSTEDGGTFQCSLDGAPFTSCATPATYTGLANGAHTVQVRAVDLSGNVDPTPASRSWTVDSAGLSLSVGADADATIAAATPETNLGAAADLIADTSPQSEGLLRFAVSGIDGSHPILQARLRLYVTNASTNAPALYRADDAWMEDSVTWGVRPARIGTPIANAGSVAVNTVVDYDVTSAVTADGSYTFDLVPESSDAANFASKEATTVTRRPQLLINFSSAPTTPETSIDSGPSGTVTSRSATLGFSSPTPGATFECSLDGAAFSACTSPASYTGLADGSHTFQVRAVAAGIPDPTPASRTWTVDATPPPAPVIVSPLDGSDSTGSIAFAGTAEPASTVTVREGATAVASATAAGDGSWSATVTAAVGPHTYTAVAADAAGNPSPPSPPVTVTVLAGPPETSIDSGPSGTTSATSAAFTFSSPAPGATFECRLDGAAFAACSSPQTYTGLAAASHVFEVRAVASGLPDPTPATATWTVQPTIFSDGFESGDLSAWSSVTTAAGGTATVQGTLVRSGAFAASLSETATSGSIAHIRRSLGTARTDVTVATDINIQTQGAASGNVPILRLFDASGARVVSLYRQNGTSNRIYVTTPGASGVATTATLTLGAWKRFEIHAVTAAAGASTLEVLADGVSVYSTTTATLGSTGILTVQIGNETGAQAFALVADGVTVRVA